MPVSFFNPATVPAPLGAYSHLARVSSESDLLVVAGQVGNELDGSVSESPVEQYRQALRNLVAILESAGAGPGDIVKLNTYLVRKLPLDQVRAVREEILGEARPAATMVYVAGLAAENLLVEVEAWATRPNR